MSSYKLYAETVAVEEWGDSNSYITFLNSKPKFLADSPGSTRPAPNGKPTGDIAATVPLLLLLLFLFLLPLLLLLAQWHSYEQHYFISAVADNEVRLCQFN